MIRLVVAILATWRLAAWLYYEDGPMDLLVRLRNWAALRWPVLDRQLSCFWCMTGWAGLAVLPLYFWCWQALLPVAFSGAAILLSYGGRVIWREMADGQG